MYFFFSKILLLLLSPLNWVLAMLTIAVFKGQKLKRRRYFIVAVTLLYIFTIPLGFKAFTRLWDVETDVRSDNVKYSCVIVLGGFSGPDRHGGGRFNWAADRFINGAQLLSTGKATHILTTGGNGSLMPGAYREA